MREPDAQSALVRAWKLNLTQLLNSEFTVEAWIINGPYHPFWSWWTVICVSLEDYPGAKPAYRQYPGAEYEFLIMSLNPDYPIDVDEIEAGGPIHRLEPPDVVVQFGALSREQAAQIVSWSAMSIVEGRSPDSDFRRWWETAVLNGAEHLRTGGMSHLQDEWVQA